MSFALRQRTKLADLLSELGPFAPTKCAGWQTQDLAAHLYIREHKPLALPGIGFARFEKQTQQIQQEALHTAGFPALVEAIRKPGWFMRPLDKLVNTSEYFIHHEDVLRANERAQELTPAEQGELWPVVQVLARRTQHAFKAQLRLERTDNGAQQQIGQGNQILFLRGLPSEMLLHLSGREANLEVLGEPELTEQWKSAVTQL